VFFDGLIDADGWGLAVVVGFWLLVCLLGSFWFGWLPLLVVGLFLLESLILAQDERWRRA
jgi:hypothetical protein